MSGSLAAGAVRGTVGAMAMTGLRTLAKELGVVSKTPPEAVAQEGVPELLRQVPPEYRGAAIELAHWSYGAAGGAVYAFLPRRLARARLGGAAYGLAVWVGFAAAIAPLLGLTPPRTQVERAVFVADHVLYGLVLAGGRA